MLVDPARVAALVVVALAVIAVPGPRVLFVVSRGVALAGPLPWPRSPGTKSGF